MKKALSLILSLLMVMTSLFAVPFTAKAEIQSGQIGDNVFYDFDTGSKTLTIRGEGATYDYSYDDNTPFNVFNFGTVNEVIIGEGVTRLGSYLFNRSRFSKITFPSSLKSISAGVFSETRNYERIDLPEGLETIETSAFNTAGDERLKIVTCPSTLKTIGEHAFYGCGCETVKILSAEKIDEYSFEYCKNLKTVILGKGVKKILTAAFNSDTAITDVFYYGTKEEWNDPTNLVIYSYNDNLRNASMHYEGGQCGDDVYYGYTYGSNLGEDYKNLYIAGTGDMYDWDNADSKSPFNGDIFLETVIIGSGVTGVGDYAFTGCIYLEKAALSGSIKTIGESAFSGSFIYKLVIPSGVETLEENVFSGCTNLNLLYIPSSVGTIEKGVFKDAPLTEVFCGAGETAWSETEVDSTDNENLINSEKHFGVPAFDKFGVELDISVSGLAEDRDVDIMLLAPYNHTDENAAVIVSGETGEIMRNEALPFNKYIQLNNKSTALWNIGKMKWGEYSVFAYAVVDEYEDEEHKTGRKELIYSTGTFTVSPVDTSVYKITDYAQLKSFAKMVNGGQTGINALITEDITATDKTWTPIGDYDNRYTGTFDGDGHTITGLSNENVTVKPDYAGLFERVGEGGVIQNVCMAGADMKAEKNIGTFAGWNNGGVIQYCCNTGAVSGSANRFAGITGTNEGVIQYCFNTGAVTNSKENGLTGGITAYNNSNGKVLNCCNTGAVTVTGENAGIGGIAGTNFYGKVKNCYNTGSISDCNYKGGIVGRKYGSAGIENCYYDKNLCGDIGAVNGAEDTTNSVIGLTTAKMTGTDALSNMTGFDDTVWMVKSDGYDDASGKYYQYYPHLKGFKYDITRDAADWPAKAEASVTWKEPESYKYTGSVIKPTVTSITVGGKALDSSAYTVSYYKKTNDSWSTDTVNPIDAGDYKAVIKFTADGHGNIEKEFTITPRSVTITAKSEEFTYDGTAHSCSLYDVDGLVGSDAISALVVGSITFPGESPVSNAVKSYQFTTGNPNNYTVTTKNGTLTMRKASVPITITSASQEWTYDGKAHSNNTVTVTNGSLFEGDTLAATAIGSVTNVSDTVSGNNAIASGYKIMHGTADVTDNYVITPVNGTLTIKPAAITITADDKESNHGTDLLALTYKIGGAYVDGDELGITLNADIDNTKPGTYTITPSWNNNSNYTATLVDGTYTVGDDPHYYGTQGDERFTCTVCGAVDDTLKAEAETADKDAADTAAAKAVTDMINALPEADKVTTADEKAITEAREAYDSLTDDRKTKVTPETVNKLTEAENALEKAQAEEAAAEAEAKAAAEKAAEEKANAEFAKSVTVTSDENGATLGWQKAPEAKRYVIYATYCGKRKYKKIKTVKDNITSFKVKKLNGKKINTKKNLKVYIVAQKKVNGKWVKLFKTPTFHTAGNNSKYTNVKKIKVKKAKFNLKVGKTAKIKAKLVLVDKKKKPINHVRKFRYMSTNTAVAKVTKKGKIKAVGKGTATIYVFSNNGTPKAIKVTVK